MYSNGGYPWLPLAFYRLQVQAPGLGVDNRPLTKRV